MYEINPAVIWFESKRAAITPQGTPSPDCFFTVQKRSHDGGNLLPFL